MTDRQKVREQIVELWRAHFAATGRLTRVGAVVTTVPREEFERSRERTAAEARALAEAAGLGGDRDLLKITTYDGWPHLVAERPPPSPFAGLGKEAADLCDRLAGRLYNWKFSTAGDYLDDIEKAHPDALRPEVREIVRHLAREHGNMGWTDGEANDVVFSMNRVVLLDPRFVRIFDECTVEAAAEEVARYAEHPAWAARLTDADREALAAAAPGPRP